MPASQARNETRLPRAVMRISADVQARLDARNKPESDPPQDPEAPRDGAAPDNAASPTPPAPPVDSRENDPLYWKQRFNVTEGILRRERTDHKTATDTLRGQMSELQEQVRTLQASAPAAPVDPSRYFTPEQIEKYGEEQCRIMATAADAAAADKFKAMQVDLDARLKPLTEARKQDQVDAAARDAQVFKDKLTELVPTWEQIDKEPAFLDWLAQDEGDTGLTRQQILTANVQRGNVKATAKIFETWTKFKTLPTPPMAPHGSAASTPAPSAQAQPAATAGAPTDAEVRDFYKRAAINKVSAAERVDFEARMKLRGPQ